jgi:hypothetical protein
MWRVILSIILILSVVLGFYYLMYRDTDSVVEEVTMLLKGEATVEFQPGTPYSRYDRSYARELWQAVFFEAQVDRIFVIHNFHDGYMWIHYEIMAYNKDMRVVHGSIAPARWTIHKEDGVWRIVAVEEDP